MNKAYSNKALPAGTVLREWRLEEVLGVGGFGIVYKGRGIYFDELVAIKEYFPSSISERDEEDTVVPIDSDAEEVHALGLKKFVEEAKLLWNLSTPTRHPNIVSVRSLFEIHGTAYMVMDFEDGIALSKVLKQGTRFNERSLWNIVRPVAEGLDRAHRVGVLHRDIKPANILINEDGRPVLIDFGSARFEAAEATSTKVTFHTPPYAALEQYVKTYPQGPWTDIYALGVVLYECVTGEKPPEVLERMHAGLGKNLEEGRWPGYSKKFLAGIDAAMTIRPQERPQSIPEWLEMFGKADEKPKRRAAEAVTDDATRVFTHELTAEEIVPVAPPVDGFPEREAVETQVPKDRSAVQFKGAGQETGARKKRTAAAVAAAALAAKPDEEEPAEHADEPAVAPAHHPHPKKHKAHAAKPAKHEAHHEAAAPKSKLSPALVGGIAATVLAAAIGGWALLGGNDPPPDVLSTDPGIATTSAAAGAADMELLAPAMKALAGDASKAGAPAAAVSSLSAASDQLAQQFQSYQALSRDPAQAGTASQRAAQMRQLATRANADFATALLRDAEVKAQRLSAAAPWASPTSAAPAAGLSPDRQQIAGSLRTSLGQLRSAADAASKASGPAQALDYARMALSQSQSFTATTLAAYNQREVAVASAPPPPTVQIIERTVAAAPKPAKTAARNGTKTAAAAASTASATTLSPGKIGQLNSIVDDARGMARQVIRMGRRSSNETLKANATLAQSYDKNLETLKDSGRGVTSDREADRLIAQAKQTRAYVQFLLRQSSKE